MGSILVLIGVGCIISAIVGGGVKLREIEVATIQSLLRQILLGLFGLALCIAGAGAWNAAADDSKHPNADSGTHAMADAALQNGSAPAPETTNTTATAPPPVQTADATPTTSFAPSPVAPIETRPLRLANRCSTDVAIRLVYKVGGNWITNDDAVWTFPAGQEDTLTYNGTPVALASDDLYFYAKAADGIHEWAGTYSLGAVGNLRKAVLTTDGSQYLMELTC